MSCLDIKIKTIKKIDNKKLKQSDVKKITFLTEKDN